MGYTGSTENEKKLLMKLYSASGGTGTQVSGADISAELGFTLCYVLRLADRLSAKGLLLRERYGKLALTDEGIGEAAGRLHRRAVLEKFFLWLGVERSEVPLCLEDVIGDRVVEAMERKMETRAVAGAQAVGKPVLVISPTTHGK